MNILLFLPGLLVLYVKRFGFIRSFYQIFLVVFVQVILAVPFLLTNPDGYIERAFNFGREFTYIWTVNYKFLTPEQFVSKTLARSLLIGHLLVLLFMGFFRWTREEGGPFRLIFSGGNNASKKKMTAQRMYYFLFISLLMSVLYMIRYCPGIV
jgi:alpha-1,3-mannosyltransferase